MRLRYALFCAFVVIGGSRAEAVEGYLAAPLYAPAGQSIQAVDVIEFTNNKFDVLWIIPPFILYPHTQLKWQRGDESGVNAQVEAIDDDVVWVRGNSAPAATGMTKCGGLPSSWTANFAAYQAGTLIELWSHKYRCGDNPPTVLVAGYGSKPAVAWAQSLNKGLVVWLDENTDRIKGRFFNSTPSWLPEGEFDIYTEPLAPQYWHSLDVTFTDDSNGKRFHIQYTIRKNGAGSCDGIQNYHKGRTLLVNDTGGKIGEAVDILHAYGPNPTVDCTVATGPARSASNPNYLGWFTWGCPLWSAAMRMDATGNLDFPSLLWSKGWSQGDGWPNYTPALSFLLDSFTPSFRYLTMVLKPGTMRDVELHAFDDSTASWQLLQTKPMTFDNPFPEALRDFGQYWVAIARRPSDNMAFYWISNEI